MFFNTPVMSIPVWNIIRHALLTVIKCSVSKSNKTKFCVNLRFAYIGRLHQVSREISFCSHGMGSL